MNNLLYIVWQPEEVIFRIGSVPVRWYGMCWLVGLVLGYFLMQWLYRRHKFPDEKFDPLFLYVFFGVLAGARLGHCLFYEPQDFLTSWDGFLSIFIPFHHLADGSWKYVGYQGLASHGGVAGLLIALYLYIRRSGMNTWVVLDFFGICSGITACFIRLGNLMNSEIIGKVTDVPWAFIFYNVDTHPRHPGQLYEAIAYLGNIRRRSGQGSTSVSASRLFSLSVSPSNTPRKCRKPSRQACPLTWDRSSAFHSSP